MTRFSTDAVVRFARFEPGDEQERAAERQHHDRQQKSEIVSGSHQTLAAGRNS
ncbi:hypothetical protein [Rhizobium sp. 007]|uniref:hypothetical protein n=1 Tax=Rhizobium sp. 007 TaxID=2785056 RepID=UPI00188F1453|nr:hypothetical protein [Rhizobium sp. 007]QPB21645.1 hypothetical protein ISN39_09515 [Rhizobium sp. 007]